MGKIKNSSYLCNGNIKAFKMRDFFVKTKGGEGEATLYTRIRKKHPSVDINVNTHIKVDVATFSRIKEDKRNGNKAALEAWLKASPKRKALRNTLSDLDRALTALAESCSYDVDDIKANIDDVVKRVVFPGEYERAQRRIQAEKEEQERIREEEERQRQKRIQEEEERRQDVLAYLDRFLDEIKTGRRKTDRNESYGANTVKVWSSFRLILGSLAKGRRLVWDGIDKSLVDDFIGLMENGGYMATSINKNLICFRALTNFAYREGIHSNARATKAFRGVKVTDDTKAREIYLTREEVRALYEMDLSGAKEMYRDVFLIGCLTCQRFSDYSRIEKGNVYTTENGVRIVELTQQKTKNKVFIPVLDDKLETLLAKYDSLPEVCDVVMNRCIKEILRDLSATVPSLAREERTILTMKERAKEKRGEASYRRDAKGYVVKPRYQMVSTHTARRTGITLLYQSHLFDVRQMMHVSGHRDTKTFLSYIKLSGKEVAEEMTLTAKQSGINPF